MNNASMTTKRLVLAANQFGYSIFLRYQYSMNGVLQNHIHARLRHAVESLRNGQDWTIWHWVLAVSPCAFIGFNSFFSTAILAAQEGFRFIAVPEFFLRAFGYCSWAFVFRGAWAIENFFRDAKGRKFRHQWLVHSGFAFIASVLFIALFSPLFFALQYPMAWRADVVARVFQVWLEHVGLLFLSYAVGVYLLRYLRAPSRDNAPQAAPRRLEVVADGARKLVAPEKINWIQAMGNYVTLHLSEGSVLVRSSLNEIQTQLDALGSEEFCRVHRSALVNITKVESHRRKPDGVYEIQLIDGETAPLSRQKLAAFRSKIAPC